MLMLFHSVSIRNSRLTIPINDSACPDCSIIQVLQLLEQKISSDTNQVTPALQMMVTVIPFLCPLQREGYMSGLLSDDVAQNSSHLSDIWGYSCPIHRRGNQSSHLHAGFSPSIGEAILMI